jgi:molybdopterin/thiamine biosynthesis adenylyltransferase
MLHSSFPKSPHPLPDAKALTEVKDLCVISHDGTPMPFREVIASTAEVDTVIVVLSNRLNRQHLHTRVTDV